MSLEQINTKRPNKELIAELECLLEDAKSGELIGMFSATYWHGDCVNHGWIVDERAKRFQMVGNAFYALQCFSNEVAAHYDDAPFWVK